MRDHGVGRPESLRNGPGDQAVDDEQGRGADRHPPADITMLTTLADVRKVIEYRRSRPRWCRHTLGCCLRFNRYSKRGDGRSPQHDSTSVSRGSDVPSSGLLPYFRAGAAEGKDTRTSE